MRSFIGVTGLLVLAIACGSGGGHREEAKDSIAECEAYVASYQGCLNALGPGGARIAGERASVLRASFVPPKDESKREALRTKCVEASRQLVSEGRCR